MESTLGALRVGGILSALFIMQSGCCTIDIGCGTRPCGPTCQTGYGHGSSRDPLFDGTLRHRVKGSLHSCANRVACAGGCGEIYWDESVNDPAVGDRCEPWSSGSGNCVSCSPWFVRLARLWGTPYSPDCGQANCGTCLGHGSLVSHLKGHLPCRSCAASHGGISSECPTCGHGPCHETYLDEGSSEVIHDGAVIHHNSGSATSGPTPAKPRAIESTPTTVPSNAQQRMRLHHRSGQSDPNGRLSAQLVNGHKHLVSNPQ